MFLDLFLGLLFLLSAMVHDHQSSFEKSLPKVIKGSFHMARSDAQPLFQAVEISLGIPNISSLKVSSSDWKTKSSTNIFWFGGFTKWERAHISQVSKKGFQKNLPNLGSLEPEKPSGTQHLPGGSSRGWPERHLHGLGALSCLQRWQPGKGWGILESCWWAIGLSNTFLGMHKTGWK